ncbi:MAG TPA: hypothetical protein QGG37_10765 [Chloroflexota bacterium]|nr:hypothetical protein [Chloroflexota bacterium]
MDGVVGEGQDVFGVTHAGPELAQGVAGGGVGEQRQAVVGADEGAGAGAAQVFGGGGVALFVADKTDELAFAVEAFGLALAGQSGRGGEQVGAVGDRAEAAGEIGTHPEIA